MMIKIMKIIKYIFFCHQHNYVIVIENDFHFDYSNVCSGLGL